jgi:gluconokinase
MNDRTQDRRRATPKHIPVAVVMGVAGCGKTVIGEALAERLGCRFIEGDRLHPPENVSRMSSGLPLTDELRAGWLDRIGAEMAASVTQGHGVVAACSALKRIYRDRLRSFVPGILFIYPEIDPETARQRVAARKGHFMPASLVDSQFATLEPPQADEKALRLDGLLDVGQLVERALEGVAQAKVL